MIPSAERRLGKTTPRDRGSSSARTQHMHRRTRQRHDMVLFDFSVSAPGIVHVLCSRSISSHVVRRTSHSRLAVSAVNRIASLTDSEQFDDSIFGQRARDLVDRQKLRMRGRRHVDLPLRPARRIGLLPMPAVTSRFGAAGARDQSGDSANTFKKYKQKQYVITIHGRADRSGRKGSLQERTSGTLF